MGVMDPARPVSGRLGQAAEGLDEATAGGGLGAVKVFFITIFFLGFFCYEFVFVFFFVFWFLSCF